MGGGGEVEEERGGSEGRGSVNGVDRAAGQVGSIRTEVK